MVKKKRSGGKGFGEPKKTTGLDKGFDFDGLLAGKQVLIAGAVMDEIKGIGDFFSLFAYEELSKRFPSFHYAANTVLTPEIVYLAKRRQLEEGNGLLTLTPKSYRQQWREVYDSDSDLIFNWWTLDEINFAQERSEVFGGTRILARLVKPLISYSTDRFPVILYAIPFSQNDETLDNALELEHAHLTLTASLDPETTKKRQNIYLIERETVALTDFIQNSVNAVVDIRKLRNYCLNPEHAQGKHKARLFASILGMTADDAEELRLILLEIVTSHEAKSGRADAFGQRYTIDFLLKWQDRSATVRSGWIVEHQSGIPRLTTCYPL